MLKKSEKKIETPDLLRHNRKEYKLMTKKKKLQFRWREQNELVHLYKTKDSREFWKGVS